MHPTIISRFPNRPGLGVPSPHPTGGSRMTAASKPSSQLERSLNSCEFEVVQTGLLQQRADLESIVQAATDAGRELCGAQFGAFFYNVINSSGESYLLYTLSGADWERFASFPYPATPRSLLLPLRAKKSFAPATSQKIPATATTLPGSACPADTFRCAAISPSPSRAKRAKSSAASSMATSSRTSSTGPRSPRRHRRRTGRLRC